MNERCNGRTGSMRASMPSSTHIKVDDALYAVEVPGQPGVSLWTMTTRRVRCAGLHVVRATRFSATHGTP